VDVRLSRAVQLLEILLRDGLLSEEQLAVELVIRPRTLACYRAGTEPMPLDRQLCLALLMLTLPARYARAGYQLRNQVRAAIRFEQRVITTNDVSPTALRSF
jgi:hypothetical protein